MQDAHKLAGSSTGAGVHQNASEILAGWLLSSPPSQPGFRALNVESSG